MESRPRLQEVADLAGVSLATASQAFSNRRPVSAHTKAKVFKAAFDLGYVAESRSGGRNIGLLLRPPESVPGFADGTLSISSLAGAVMVALLGAGFSVSSFQSLDDVGAQVGRLNAFVLLHPNWKDDALSALVRRGIPTVSCDSDPGNGAFRWWVGQNYATSTRKMLRHLHASGSKRPGLILGTTRNAYNSAIANVYLEDMRRRGLTPLIRELDPSRGQTGGTAATRSLLSAETPPDSILTSSGLFAVGAAAAIRALGTRLPENVLVASMMDGALLEHLPVPITAMRPNVTETAQRVTRLLIQRLNEEPPPPPDNDLELELELVSRMSTLRASDFTGRPIQSHEAIEPRPRPL